MLDVKRADADCTNSMKEYGSGKKEQRNLTAESATNGVKLDRCLVVSWLAWFINSSLKILLARFWVQG